MNLFKVGRNYFKDAKCECEIVADGLTIRKKNNVTKLVFHSILFHIAVMEHVDVR